MKYYLHDSNARNDEKVTLLFIEFGYEGLGLFYCILEVLSSQEKPVSEKVLKAQLNIKKRLEKQLHFMYEIGVLSVKNGDVFNENILNFSEKYQIKKQKTRERISEWREKQIDKENVTCYKSVRNSPKVKESKVKESKVNKKREIIFPFTSNEFINIWNLWKEYKHTEHKFRYKSEISEQSSLKKLSGLAKGNENTAIQILEDAMANGYKGFFELKNNNNGRDNKDEQRNEKYNRILQKIIEKNNNI